MPTGCISIGRHGKKLAPLSAMAKAGAVAFTDDGSTVTNDSLMAQAMKMAKSLNLPIMDHALDPLIAGNGVMREGARATQLGLPSIPPSAEIKIVQRDIKLSEQTDCAVHIQHVSTKESVSCIREARRRGLHVSAEATPHHLALTDSDVRADNTSFKVNPPLGNDDDRNALMAAVADGTLQVLATDHAPHYWKNKQTTFINAPFGIIGLETAVGITYTLLVKSGLMNVMEWVNRWTIGPANVLGKNPPNLAPGQEADISILDLDSEWTIHSREFLSKSKNTPFENRKITGHAVCAFCQGVITYKS